MVIARGKGRWGQVEEGKGAYMGIEGDFTLGNGHKMQYEDDVCCVVPLKPVRFC